MYRKVTFLFLVIASLVTTSGCKIFMGDLDGFLADEMVGTLENTAEKFFEEKSVLHAKNAGPGLLKVLDGVIMGSPYNYDLLLLGAKLNAGYALAFYEDEDELAARFLYDKAHLYAVRAFDCPELNSALKKNSKKVAKALEDFGSSWAPWMFWAGESLASSINLNKDNIDAVGDLAKAKAFIDRVIELKRGDYFYGGPYVVRGIYHCSKLGGDLEIARQSFEKALEINQRKFLMFIVFYAKYYAVKVKDDKEKVRLFKSLLQEVIDAPDDILPAEHLANQVAKRKARNMLKNIDKYIAIPKKDDPLTKKKEMTEGEKKKALEEDTALFEGLGGDE